MDIELNQQNAVKGAGVWHHQSFGPTAFAEASSNIAVSAAVSGLPPTLTWNGSAGTSDEASLAFTLPPNFKRQKDRSNAKIYAEVSVANVSLNGIASNDDIEVDLKFAFYPPKGSSESIIAGSYIGTRISAATNLDPTAGGFLTTYRVDALASLTAAQKLLLDAGWTMYMYVRPDQSTTTNVGMLLGSARISYLGHLDYSPTLTTLA